MQNTKYAFLIKLIIVTGTVYLVMKYLLPLFLPFLLAFLISSCINPVVKFLHTKLKINETVSIIFVIVIFVSVAVIGIGYLAYQIYVQGSDLIEGLPNELGNRCRNFVVDNKEKFVSYAMDGTKKTVTTIVNAAVFVVTMLVSAYFITKDRKKIHEYRKIMPYAEEVNRITAKLNQVFSAYIKAQLIVMSVTAVVCVVGLYIIGNKYALLLGVIIGFLDAFPMIGAGIILLPWSVYYFFVGNFQNGAIIFCVFVVCYIAREVLEPRIMGHGIGLSPIMSIISIYIGYALFGIIGVVLGPVGYVIIEQLMMKEEKQWQRTKK